MKSLPPPRLASWLLKHQVGGYRAESLIGDLTEEYTHGRGDGWFWRQVMLAVAGSYFKALRLYGLRILGAVAAAWGVLLTGIMLLEWVWGPVQHQLIAFSADLPAQQRHTLIFLSGIVWTLLAGCIDVIVGRLVVHIYRPHQRFVAGVFILTILVYMLPSIYGLAMEAFNDCRHIPFLTQQLVATFLWMASAWLGASWQMRINTKSTMR